jgi:hypothetical protein
MYDSYVTKFKAKCNCLTGFNDQKLWQTTNSDFLAQQKLWKEEKTYEWT